MNKTKNKTKYATEPKPEIKKAKTKDEYEQMLMEFLTKEFKEII